MNIYVGNISYKSTVDDLGNLFAEYGDVTSVKLLEDRLTEGLKVLDLAENGRRRWPSSNV